MVQPTVSGENNPPAPFQITKKTLQSLAPLPATAVQLLALLDQPDTSLRKIADVASRDVGIAAAMLRMANSPIFGMRGRVGSIGEAIRLIGTAQARLLVLTWGVAQAGQKELWLYGLPSGAFLRHSELVATLSMAIAREVQYPASGVAYSAGLLHDIGKVIINAIVVQGGPGAPKPEAFVNEHAQPAASIVTLERDGVGTDHATVGRDLATLWSLPTELSDAMFLHHANPVRSPPSLAAIVALANAVAGQVDERYPAVLRAAFPETHLVPIDTLVALAQEALE